MSKKVSTRFTITIGSVCHVEKLTGSAYVKYKRGDKSSNKGTTSVVPLNPDGSVDFNETVSITSTLLRNIKTHQFEPKNISFTVCLTDSHKVKSDKDKAIVGKLVLDLSKFFDQGESKLIEHTLNSKALKKKKPNVPTLTLKVVGHPEDPATAKSKKLADGSTADSEEDSISMSESNMSTSESDADYLSFSESVSVSEMRRNPNLAAHSSSSSASLKTSGSKSVGFSSVDAVSRKGSDKSFSSISVSHGRSSVKSPRSSTTSPSPSSRAPISPNASSANLNPFDSFDSEPKVRGNSKSPRNPPEALNPFEDEAEGDKVKKSSSGIIGSTFGKIKHKWRKSVEVPEAPQGVNVGYAKALEAFSHVLLGLLAYNPTKLFISDDDDDFETIIDLLSLADEELTDRDIPRSLYVRTISQVFYVINCVVFNGLLEVSRLTAKNAYRIKNGISRIEQWASTADSLVTAASLVPLVRDQFEHLISAANVIAIEKTTFTGDFDFQNNTLFPKVNIRQIDRLLDKFHPDEFARHQMPQAASAVLKKLVLATVPQQKLQLVPPPFSY